ncbi:inhibitor of the pro-sigma K processing machinery [Bacillus oleivorans]|uniref:Inhibitor of the pro-sigma K processing machinery n=1 Tax=Bacillus oleivorans TaxID=1448271 RepID=A0A285D7D5_9BACI|nr:pro-sigmaK processing inhibitor BofA family protein [Bacillus oleivorans]SNX75731.1 inhibitor of the pro-sigma K processing machinery [Bacillus oleivorans]
MDSVWIIAGAVILIILLLFTGASIKPLRYIGNGLIKILIGALLLFFLNAIGGQFGIHVPINIVTSVLSGFLGVPGVVALAAIDIWVLPV